MIKRKSRRVAKLLFPIVNFLIVAVLQAEGSNLRVVSWNVLYGFNHGQSVEEAGAWLGEQGANVVALQELNGISEDGLVKLARHWGHRFAVTHKEAGFPVGLTSRKPIQVLERKVEGFHHGYLHVRTYEIHFFVVHFWPGKNERHATPRDHSQGSERSQSPFLLERLRHLAE